MTRSSNMLCFALLVTVATIGLASEVTANAQVQNTDRPNILLIVADDMGFSDLGSYGSEIATPNLDALASRGIRFTNFYAAPTCSPTRAMLLTGTDNHVAGLGNMAEWLGPEQQDQPGYEGYLNDRVATVASLLKEDGYLTTMAGKWHLGEHDREMWPAARGFARDFSVLDGAGSHWGDMQGLNPRQPKLQFTRDGKIITQLPDDHFSSVAFTDFIISSLEDQRDTGDPFFAYLAFQAPHGPLAVPDNWRERYKTKYSAGYDQISADRLERQKRLGIVERDVVAFPRVSAWSDLADNERMASARKMELYAAMVAHMDDQIGRLLKYIETIGAIENTLVIFLSDNGSAGEDIADLIAAQSLEAKSWLDMTFDNRFENWGRPGSLVDYGPAWAQVGMTPFRQFKGVSAEGGIRMPLIIAGPGVNHKGTVNHSITHVMDIVPTLQEAAGVSHPAIFNAKPVAPIQGRSMKALLSGDAKQVRPDDEWLGWELFGNRALRQGEWKLLSLLKRAGGTGDWQLFNLADDPSEQNDLSTVYPEKRQALIDAWQIYAAENGVASSHSGPFEDQ